MSYKAPGYWRLHYRAQPKSICKTEAGPSLNKTALLASDLKPKDVFKIKYFGSCYTSKCSWIVSGTQLWLIPWKKVEKNDKSNGDLSYGAFWKNKKKKKKGFQLYDHSLAMERRTILLMIHAQSLLAFPICCYCSFAAFGPWVGKVSAYSVLWTSWMGRPKNSSIFSNKASRGVQRSKGWAVFLKCSYPMKPSPAYV